MVKDRDSETVIATLTHRQNIKLSLKRWFKHGLYFKSSKKIFSTVQRQQIADAIEQAENGHRGEIQIIIEASLPGRLAFEMDTRQRAEQLFAEYKVWDTECNSGILIYLNLCEHAVEIVADRGIDQAVQSGCWHGICQNMLPYFKQGQFTEGLCDAIARLGQLLSQYYGNDTQDCRGNELSNMPKLL